MVWRDDLLQYRSGGRRCTNGALQLRNGVFPPKAIIKLPRTGDATQMGRATRLRERLRERSSVRTSQLEPEKEQAGGKNNEGKS